MYLFIWVCVQVQAYAWVHVGALHICVLVCGSHKDDIGCPLLGSTLFFGDKVSY